MKKLLVILLLAISAASYSQIRKIPSEVTDAFKEKYPHAEKVEWKDKLTAFVVSFEDDGKKYESRFSNKGNWIQTENKVEEDDLPSQVKDGLDKSKYSDWETTAFYRIQLPEDKLQFRISVKKSDLQKKNLLFNEEGRLLKDNITF